MNEQNYASLEASKRLVEVGIVLETEHVWIHDVVKQMDYDSWSISLSGVHSLTSNDLEVPAPSMAEVWRELPEGCYVYKGVRLSEAYRKFGDPSSHISTNPTDALIDLLIWVKKEQEK